MASRNSLRRLIFLLLVGWQLINESITPLLEGRVVYRDYKRDNSNETLQIILTEGDEVGGLYIPDKVNEAKGVLPNESGYEILEVAGKKALIENKPYMPLALAVHVDENTTLTIESPSLNRDELINIATQILYNTSENL